MRRRLALCACAPAGAAPARGRRRGRRRAGHGGRALAPSDVAALGDGAVLIADTGHSRVRLVDAAGVITSVAGGGTATSGPAAAVDIELVRPTGLAVDPAGGFVIADAGADRAWRVDADGVARVIAGSGERGFSGDGGAATAARLAQPTGVTVPDGAVLIADMANDRIRRVSTEGTITTVAGGAPDPPSASDIAVFARLSQPAGVSALPNGGFLIADAGNHRIAQVAYGVLTTVAGTGDGRASPTLPAAATTTALGTPVDVAATPGGGFVVADQDTQQIRKRQPGRPRHDRGRHGRHGRRAHGHARRPRRTSRGPAA